MITTKISKDGTEVDIIGQNITNIGLIHINNISGLIAGEETTVKGYLDKRDRIYHEGKRGRGRGRGRGSGDHILDYLGIILIRD